MGESLPNTIDPSSEKYVLLGRELDTTLGRHDGAEIARSLHAHFEQDLRDWFYDHVFEQFRNVPIDVWSDNDQMTSEFKCRNLISFMQAWRGSRLALQRGIIPIDLIQWYTSWLLRLNIGDADAEQALVNWVPVFREFDVESQWDVFAAKMENHLPEVEGKRSLLRLYCVTLEQRVCATTVRAFEGSEVAVDLREKAKEGDDALDRAIQLYRIGGGRCYVLESAAGVLVTKSRQFGRLFHIWRKEMYASEFNDAVLHGSERVSEMSYRELFGQLRQLESGGIVWVAVDWRATEEGGVWPCEKLQAYVAEKIAEVESSGVGKMILDENAAADEQ